MDVLVERCAGLDVHRDTVVATVRRTGRSGSRCSQTRTFTTMTGALEELADWLVPEKVTLAGMESSDVYWKPVYYVLEERLSVWVINAGHLRNVPGRKTDVGRVDVDRAVGRARVGVAEFCAPRVIFGCYGMRPESTSMNASVCAPGSSGICAASRASTTAVPRSRLG